MKSRVYTLERIFDLHRMAKTTLSKLKMHPEKIKWSDGYLGLSENAPFDKILVTAGCPNIPTQLLNQLSINGKMIIPVGLDNQEMCLDGLKRVRPETRKQHFTIIVIIIVINCSRY